MKEGEGFSPKYWVGHHKENFDVMLFSASKSREETLAMMECAYGEDWFLDENFEVILIEIKKVEL